jgi:5-methyltetrahydropteroyltriglutamate--homocysteine methyltransferase
MSGFIEHIDHVGSLQRPPELLRAYLAWLSSGEPKIPAELQRISDKAILSVMGSLTALGLPINDGEFRRTSYLDLTRLFKADAFNMTDGYALTWHDDTGKASPEMAAIKAPLVVSRLQPTGNHVLGDEGQFVLDNVPLLGLDKARTKVTLPSPAHLGLLGWNEERTREFYPTRIDLMEEAAKCLASEAKRLAEAGYQYVQVDSPTYHNFFDEKLTKLWRERGVDLEALLPAAVACDNRILAAAKEGGALVTGLHICLGNGSGYRLGEGSYKKIAEAVFPQLKADRLLLEFSSAISGEADESRYESLQYVRPETTAVLGLVSSKHAALEDPAAVRAQVKAASRFLPRGLEQAALAPQCGFASGLTGNPEVPITQQWRKLRHMVQIAEGIWS